MKQSKTCLYGSLFIAAAALSSCAADEPLIPESETETAISFGTYIQTSSRASVVDNSALQKSGFGVLGYSTTDADFTASSVKSSKPNFMNQQKVEYTNNAWTYSPLKYWPSSETKLSFLAYGPYKKVNDNLDFTGDQPVVKYTVAESGALATDKMYDLVAAQNLNLTRDNTPGAVKFQFEHALTRLAINLKAADTYYDQASGKQTYIVVKSISFSGSKLYTSGDLNLENNSWANTASAGDNLISLGTLAKSTAVKAGEKYSETGVKLGENSSDVNVLGDDQYLFLIPNEDVIDGEFNVKFEADVITIDDQIDGKVLKQDLTKTLSLNTTFEQGKAYSLNFTFSLDAILFDADVTQWDETSVNGTLNPNKTYVEPIEYPKYYLYGTSEGLNWNGGTELNGPDKDGSYTISLNKFNGNFMIGTTNATDDMYGTTVETTIENNGEYTLTKGARSYLKSNNQTFTNVTITFTPNADGKTATVKFEGTKAE